MSIETEIRIAKLQIMWSIYVAVLGLYLAMQEIGNFWTIGYIPLFSIVWYFGCIYLRRCIEKQEIEKNAAVTE